MAKHLFQKGNTIGPRFKIGNKHAVGNPGPIKHGHARRDGNKQKLSGAYISWRGMKARCLNPKEHNYHNYGGRGISIHPRWMVFENFLEDMGDREAGLSIERLDNDGNYEPGNCVWADKSTQNRNQRPRRRMSVAA